MLMLMMAIVLPASATLLMGQALPITDANVKDTCYTLAAITGRGISSEAAFGIILAAKAIRDEGYACEDAFFSEWKQELVEKGVPVESLIETLPQMPGWTHMPGPEPLLDPDVTPIPGINSPDGALPRGPTSQGPTSQPPIARPAPQ